MVTTAEYHRILEDATKAILELHKKGDKLALKKHVAVVLSGLISLSQQHDSTMISYRDELQLLSDVKAEYRDAAIALDERRGAQMAMLSIINSVHGMHSSSGNQTPAQLLEELEIDTQQDGNAAMHSDDEQFDHPMVVEMLIQEYEKRQQLQSQLDDVQARKKALQAKVGKKREFLSGLQELVPDIQKKSKSAFEEIGLGTSLPAVQRVPAACLPTPLYVLYSNLCHVKALSGAEFQVEPVEAHTHTQAALESPDASSYEFVRLTMPAPSKCKIEKSLDKPCVVNFRFCKDMNTVLADCDSHEGLLDSIDSSDKGASWPHSAHNCKQEKPLPEKGRPYKWCQHLGGLDLYLLPSTTEDGGGGYTFSASMFLRCVNRLLTAVP